MRFQADTAIIAPRKLRDYLLSPDHPEGRGKAARLAVLGYAREDWGRLAADLRAQHLNVKAVPTERTRFGQKYEILAWLQGPNGNRGLFRSIWIVECDGAATRLVTLVPVRR